MRKENPADEGKELSGRQQKNVEERSGDDERRMPC